MNPIFVTEELLKSINCDDPFFDSFRTQYINFTSWFHFLATTGKKAWIFRDNCTIGAFLLMEEDDYISGAPQELAHKKRLNISRLKIAAEMGSRMEVITELFLKIAIEEALHKGIAEIYFTCFPGYQANIVSALIKIGFEKLARKTNNEDIYLKCIKPPSRHLEPAEIMEKYYPAFYDGIKVKKYIFPVSPLQHNRIFTDSREYKPILFESAGEKFIEGNTINKFMLLKDKKALVLERGDILLIYRSTDTKAITSLCIVDTVEYVKSEIPDIHAIKNQAEVEVLVVNEEQQERKTGGEIGIAFRWHFHLPVYIDTSFLQINKIHTGNLNRIIRIDHRKYRLILEKSRLNEDFILH